MAKHAYFEELCALAPLGELSPSQLRELDEHTAECETCRQASIGYNRFFLQVVPVVTRTDEEYIESRRRDMRSAVMQSVAAIEREHQQPVAIAKRDRLMPLSLLACLPKDRLSFYLWATAGAVCVAAAAFWIGAFFHESLAPHKTPDAAVVSATTAAAALAVPAALPAVVTPPATGDSNDKQLQAALDEERQRNAELAAKLSAEDGKLAEAIATQDALRAQIDQQTQTLAATKADLESKTAALSQARSASSSNDATVAGLELQVRDLTEKMNVQNASLDRERDLLSHGREIRDIIGARNLHIVDVYDTTTEGTTRRPFARAFYTEGKSLVYYAYDLPQRKIEEGKFAYVAWGQSNGSKASVRKIGILFHDDQTQQRWSLNFTDPQVLREIDSVFITLERNDKELSEPKGKRMLTAYLGTAPNHP